MYKSRISLKNIILGVNNFSVTTFNKFSNGVKNNIKIEKVLVVSKLSRYEYEKNKYKNLTDNELEKILRNRGSDYEKLLHYHHLHKTFENNVVNTLKNMGIDVQIVNKLNYTDDKVAWADVIMPTGGDGTFLFAASRVLNNKKPVIGFNSDPNRSEGYLCLPKKYSSNIREAIERLQTGNFKWLFRSRIRTTITGQANEVVPTHIHESDPNFKVIIGNKKPQWVLPVLALNEVFIGECLSARVSHLEIRFNNVERSTNVKCSGLCVSTGTGSTSWHLSINRLPVQSVAELLRLIDIDPTEGKDSLATVLADIYSKNLIFPPDDKRLGYTIRDLISAGVWPKPRGIKSRGFATKVEVKSLCFDAGLVIDGGISFSFNDGTIAVLEIYPEDSLRTVSFTD